MADAASNDSSREDSSLTATAGRALVPLARPGGNIRAPARGARPSAAFLAQLAATAQHLPQTRTRRRATAADAVALYNAFKQRQPRMIERSM